MLALDRVSGRVVRVIVSKSGVVSIRTPDGSRITVAAGQLLPL